MDKIYTVALPDIGEGVVEGEVVEWFKKVGEPLKQDEPVVAVMTDKATVELPAPYPGKLAKQYYQPGETARLAKPLYDIELADGIQAGEGRPKPSEPAEDAKPKGRKPADISKPAPAAEPSLLKPPPAGKALAIPAVRQLAKQLGIDLERVAATGKRGRVTVGDLKKHLAEGRGQALSPQPLTAAPIPSFPGDEEVPLIGIKRLMAAKMAESNAHIPHFSYFEQADAGRLVQLRENVRKKALEEGMRLTFMPFFIRALSLCIKQFPELNSSLDLARQKWIVHHQHHVGIAIASRQGLIVPVLKNVQEMSFDAIVRSYESLVDKAKHGKLASEDMKGATITISNFGVLGNGLWATPVITFPETAILALGRIHKQPVVKNDNIVAKEMLNVSWSFDHRVIDGDLAAKISRHFCSLVSNPAGLL